MRNTTILISIVFCISYSVQAQSLKKEYINPTPGYTNVVAVNTGLTTTLYIAGQVGSGETMEEQIRSSYQALLKQLSAADASFSDLVKITIYIVDYKEEQLPLFKKVRLELFDDQTMPAITLVGVSALALDTMKVEMEAVAIIENK